MHTLDSILSLDSILFRGGDVGELNPVRPTLPLEPYLMSAHCALQIKGCCPPRCNANSMFTTGYPVAL